MCRQSMLQNWMTSTAQRLVDTLGDAEHAPDETERRRLLANAAMLRAEWHKYSAECLLNGWDYPQLPEGCCDDDRCDTECVAYPVDG